MKKANFPKGSGAATAASTATAKNLQMVLDARDQKGNSELYKGRKAGLNPNEYVVVHCWRPMIGGTRYTTSAGAAKVLTLGSEHAIVGHVSISIHRPNAPIEYISAWPEDSNPGLAAVPGKFATFYEDLSGEGEGRFPDAQIVFYSLDINRMSQLFSSFKEKEQSYWQLQVELPEEANENDIQNCSAQSWNHLLAGGILDLCDVDEDLGGPKSAALRKRYKCDEGQILWGLFDKVFWRKWFVSPATLLNLVAAAKENELARYPVTAQWDGRLNLPGLTSRMMFSGAQKMLSADEHENEYFTVKRLTEKRGPIKSAHFNNVTFPTYKHTLSIADKTSGEGYCLHDIGDELLGKNPSCQMVVHSITGDANTVAILCGVREAPADKTKILKHFVIIVGRGSDDPSSLSYFFQELSNRRIASLVFFQFFSKTKALLVAETNSANNARYQLFIVDFEMNQFEFSQTANSMQEVTQLLMTLNETETTTKQHSTVSKVVVVEEANSRLAYLAYQQNPPPIAHKIPARVMFLHTTQDFEGVSRSQIANYQSLLREQPEDVSVLYQYGTALAKEGQHQQAITIFDKILGLQQHHEDALYMRGKMLLRLKRANEALSHCNAALRVYKNSSKILYCRARANAMLNRCEQALADFDHVLRLGFDVNSFLHRIRLLKILEREISSNEVLASYRKILNQDPNNYDLLFGYGCLLHELHRYNEALHVFQQVGDGDYRALHNCGVIHLKMGQINKALDIFEKLRNEHSIYFQLYKSIQENFKVAQYVAELAETMRPAPSSAATRDSDQYPSATVAVPKAAGSNSDLRNAWSLPYTHGKRQPESRAADQKVRVNVTKANPAMPKSSGSKHASLAATTVATLVRNIHRFHKGATALRSPATSSPRMDSASLAVPIFRGTPKVHSYRGFSYSQEKPQLMGMLDDQKVIFDHYEATPDGRCGFYSIGVYGEGDHFYDPVIHTLLTHADKPVVRASLADEIAHDVVNELTSSDIDEGDKIWNADTHVLLSAIRVLDEKENAKQPVENKAYKDLIEACKHPDVYRKYVNHLGQRGWLGCVSAKIVAQYGSRPFSLYIWEEDSANPPNGIKIKDSYVNPALADVKHIFYTNGYTHFDFLAISPNQLSKAEVKSSSNRTSSDAKKVAGFSDNKTAVAAMGALGFTAAATKIKDSKLNGQVETTSSISLGTSNH